MSGSRKQPAPNHPCPCGSGKNYQHCCAVQPPPPRLALGPLTAHGREVASEAAVGRAIRRGTPPVPPPGEVAASPVRRSAEVARCLSEGRRHFDAGRVAEALPLLIRATQLDPADPHIWNDAGMALLRCSLPADAAGYFTAAIRLDPQFALAHHHLGVAFARQGRAAEAIEAHATAVGLMPKFADAWFHLGTLWQARGQTEQAAEAFDQAAAATAGTTKGRFAAARALLMRKRPDEAVALLQRALALDPGSVDLRSLLSNTLIASGRFAEADKYLGLALASKTPDAASLYQLATSRRMTPADQAFLQRMNEALRVPFATEQDRMMLHFALGKSHDDLHEFEAAIAHFDAANRLRSAAAPLDRQGSARLIDRTIELFPAGAFDANGLSGIDDERPVLILGMPRSGTTLIEQILSSHPGVAAGGELGFWGEHGAPLLAHDTGAITPDRLRELAGEYRTLLRGISADALRVTDKNPFNFLYIGLLRMAFPGAFVVHCRRHPVDNCLSIYATNFFAHDIAFMGNREDLVFYYRGYARLMQHWREALPPERFLEVDYEAMVSDPETQTRRLVAFCGLKWDEACLRPERNPRNITTASRWQVRQPVYRSSLERWRNYQPWLGPFAELLPPA